MFLEKRGAYNTVFNIVLSHHAVKAMLFADLDLWDLRFCDLARRDLVEGVLASFGQLSVDHASSLKQILVHDIE
jgi:hypothetical protein